MNKDITPIKSKRKTRSPHSIQKLQTRMVDRLIKASPPFLKDCEFRPIQSIAEFKLAAHLVYMEYYKKNYTLPNKNQLRITIHQLIRESTTFIVVYKKKYVLATFTLIEDSPLGLPMDKIYPKEIGDLRRTNRRILEVTMLATHQKLLSHPSMNFSQADRLLVLLHLIRSGVQYMRKWTDKDMVVISVHPRHEMFYRGIQFKPLGGLKQCTHVQGSPALAFQWDWREMEERTDGALQQFFGFHMPRTPQPKGLQKLLFKLDEFGEMLMDSLSP